MNEQIRQRLAKLWFDTEWNGRKRWDDLDLATRHDIAARIDRLARSEVIPDPCLADSTVRIAIAILNIDGLTAIAAAVEKRVARENITVQITYRSGNYRREYSSFVLARGGAPVQIGLTPASGEFTIIADGGDIQIMQWDSRLRRDGAPPYQAGEGVRIPDSTLWRLYSSVGDTLRVSRAED